jgi:A/G-specific adenine glycosylase
VPFTQTSRYFRGRVLAAVRELEPGGVLSLAELGPRVKSDWVPDDLTWLRDIVGGLARDGLLRVEATGDAGGDDAPGAMEQVSLP